MKMIVLEAHLSEPVTLDRYETMTYLITRSDGKTAWSYFAEFNEASGCLGDITIFRNAEYFGSVPSARVKCYRLGGPVENAKPGVTSQSSDAKDPKKNT